ncbi:MAG: hypothetical protein MK212_05200 [Saprospiraceae bacterium]|nr:hypothetical protein [Saprospiraceae bacterium]
MKLLKGISLFASALFLLSSCGGGNSELLNNELVKQLPDDQKNAMVKLLDGQCKCFSEMKGDMNTVLTAAKSYSTKVDEFVAAIESGDVEKTKEAESAVSEASDAISTAQKAIRDANPDRGECQKKLMESLSDDEKKAFKEANVKIESLAKEKYGEEEAGKKLGELATISCPKMKTGNEMKDILSAARDKYSDNMDKFMKMKMNAMMNPGGTTEGDSTSTETTPEG